MDAIEVDSGRPSFDPGASEEEAVAPRSGLLASSWHGAKTGFRGTSYIIGPLASGLLIAGLVPTALGLGAGCGFAVPSVVPAAFALYAMFAFLGMVAGGLIGLVGALIGPVRPGTAPGELVGRRPPADPRLPREGRYGHADRWRPDDSSPPVLALADRHPGHGAAGDRVLHRELCPADGQPTARGGHRRGRPRRPELAGR